MHTGCPVQGNAPDGDSPPSVRATRRTVPRRSDRSTRPARAAEELRVAKAVLTIGAIGVAGCVLLAAMMKDLVHHGMRGAGPSGSAAVASRFAGRLAVPLVLREEHVESRVRLVAHARAKSNGAGERRQLAEQLADALWRDAAAGERVHEVEVVVRDPDGKAPITAIAPRAAAPR
jgi:hypothetical protein